MRVVFVNLHSDWMLVKSASVYIFRFSPAIKHGYLLRYLLNIQNMKFVIILMIEVFLPYETIMNYL